MVDSRLIVFANGTKVWYLKSGSVYHRTDGPAVERLDGYKAWYLYGLRHRIDGPAIMYPNGQKYYWLNGTEYTEEHYLQAVIEYKLKQFIG